MASQVYCLEQHNFRSHIDSVGDAILRVTEGSDTSIPGSVVEYFDQEYPSAFQYLTIRREEVSVQAWWNKNFKNGYTSMPRFQLAGAAGYYLFIKGVPVEWTNGQDGDGGAASMVDLVGMLMFKDDSTMFQSIQVEREKRRGKVVNEHFERYLQRDPAALRHIQAKAAKGRAAQKAQAAEAARRIREAVKNFKFPGAGSPPPEPKAPAPQDPYEVLGITRSTPPEEIKKAMNARRQETHPDKVNTMAPAIRAVAEEEFKKVQAAVDAIKAERGW